MTCVNPSHDHVFPEGEEGVVAGAPMTCLDCGEPMHWDNDAVDHVHDDLTIVCPSGASGRWEGPGLPPNATPCRECHYPRACAFEGACVAQPPCEHPPASATTTPDRARREALNRGDDPALADEIADMVADACDEMGCS